MTPAELSLAGEFPAATRQRWQELAGEVPASLTYDGISRAPLYTAEDVTPAPRIIRATAGWDVRQRHLAPDIGAIRDDLENGVTSLWLVGAATGVARDFDVPVVLDAGAGFRAAATALLEKPGAGGNLGADPIGVAARTGAEPELAGAAELAVLVSRDFPQLRAIVVDALPYHEAGGSDAQELGCSVAAGVAYLRALTDAGLDPGAAAGQLEFRYAATVDQFLTIAKFRAARRLWARVTEVCGAVTEQRQHAVTAPAMLTRRDPWVNMLRATVACFAAGVGGADAITVLPFDSAIGRPDAFGRRIARNTQSILREESHVDAVVDPAGESWYVERLTDDLAEAAWSWFTEIERAGGLPAALDSGLIHRRLAETRRARRENLARGIDKITGVTEYADPDERPVVRSPAAPLPRMRYPEDFE